MRAESTGDPMPIFTYFVALPSEKEKIAVPADSLEFADERLTIYRELEGELELERQQRVAAFPALSFETPFRQRIPLSGLFACPIQRPVE